MGNGKLLISLLLKVKLLFISVSFIMNHYTNVDMTDMHLMYTHRKAVVHYMLSQTNIPDRKTFLYLYETGTLIQSENEENTVKMAEVKKVC